MYRSVILWIRTSFGFSRTEAKGYLVLIALLLVVHFVIIRIPSKSYSSFEDPGFLDSLSQLVSAHQNIKQPQPKVMPLFNPNTVSYDSLIEWGMEPFVASNMIKYRNAGGYFVQTDDLKKIFGMTDSIWNSLNHLVKLEGTDGNTQTPAVGHPKKKYQKSVTPMDINEVDSVWLRSIYGIGTVLSKRIVKYRDLLGGFYSLDQLSEVYGLPAEALSNLKEKIYISSKVDLRKVNINTLNHRDMASHPYFSFNQARAIIAYKEQHGIFANVDQLKNIHLIDDSTYLRVYPYLDF